MTARTRPIAGAAALAYVVAAAVENMGVLDAPLLGATRAVMLAVLSGWAAARDRGAVGAARRRGRAAQRGTGWRGS